jgi:hypothetical protein
VAAAAAAAAAVAAWLGAESQNDGGGRDTPRLGLRTYMMSMSLASTHYQRQRHALQSHKLTTACWSPNPPQLRTHTLSHPLQNPSNCHGAGPSPTAARQQTTPKPQAKLGAASAIGLTTQQDEMARPCSLVLTAVSGAPGGRAAVDRINRYQHMTARACQATGHMGPS